MPRQFPSTRRVQVGDVVVSEISAAFFDHSGQVLRSFTVGAEPSPLYRDLHAVADAAFDRIAAVLRAGATPAQVIEASGVIEEAGFTIIDDLLHGYGGGYLAPILGSKSRPAGPIPDEPFRAGQTVVIQPNVVTRDHKAGVQTGEMVLITEIGIERLHTFPARLRAGVTNLPPATAPPSSRRRTGASGRPRLLAMWLPSSMISSSTGPFTSRASRSASRARHDAVEPAVHDEHRAGDALRDAFERQRRGLCAAPRRRWRTRLRTRNASRVSSGRPSQPRPS